MKRARFLLAFLLPLLVGLWFRWPYIAADMPYFYAEDEGHHFNRVAEMAKSGDLNPHYFHKPSLHFYLRIPVIYLAYWREKKLGHIESINQIRTRDPHGLGDYAYTASHPAIVKANRALSVVFSLAMVGLSFLLAASLTQSVLCALAAGLFCALSPEAIAYSAIIGVDGLMSAFCMLAIYLSLLLYRHFSNALLVISGLVCGLAISSKYNAGPIGVLPLATCLLVGRCSAKTILLAIGTPVLGFFLASPYILVSFSEFKEQLSYEIWHYSVAGHVGHEAKPGLEQALFYFNWLNQKALGFGILIFGLLGFIFLPLSKLREGALVVLFPLLYALMMICQKANFERNMLVILPCLSLLAAYTLHLITHSINISRSAIRPLFCICSFILLVQPSIGALHQQISQLSTAESRRSADQWIRQIASVEQKIGLAAEILFSPDLYKLSGVAKIEQNEETARGLYQKGLSRLIIAPGLLESSDLRTQYNSFFEHESQFAGVESKQRILQNPLLEVLKARPSSAITESLWETEKQRATEFVCQASTELKSPESLYECKPAPQANGEEHFWLTNRIQFISLNMSHAKLLEQNDAASVSLEIEVMSPWPKQNLQISCQNDTQDFKIASTEAGSWEVLKFKLSKDSFSRCFSVMQFEISQIHSPKLRGLNQDPRYLGVAVRSIRVKF